MDKTNELLRYGTFIEDVQTKEENGYRRTRVIEYKGKRYLHEMFNGKVIKCCEVWEKLQNFSCTENNQVTHNSINGK